MVNAKAGWVDTTAEPIERAKARPAEPEELFFNEALSITVSKPNDSWGAAKKLGLGEEQFDG